MDPNQATSGTIDVETITLHTRLGPLNIRELVTNLTIREGMYMPGVIAEFVLDDSKELLANLPFLGEEKITIEFKAPSRKPVKYTLTVVSIEDTEFENAHRAKSHVIKAASVETIKNASTQIQKSYNTNISNMVSDIMKTYTKTEKKVNVQETRGVQPILIQNQTPFDAIEMLRRRAVATGEASSLFVFFENSDGYNFFTLENMFKNPVGDQLFSYRVDTGTQIEESRFKDILAMSVPHQSSSIQNIFGGGLMSRVATLDFKTLEYAKKDNKTDSKKFTNPDGTVKNATTETHKAEAGESAGVTVFVPVDSALPPTYISDTYSNSLAGAQIYFQTVLNLEVYGDSELKTGGVIELNIEDFDITTQTNKPSKLLSGKFLITELTHSIELGFNNTSYSCFIECIKGGPAEDIL